MTSQFDCSPSLISDEDTFEERYRNLFENILTGIIIVEVIYDSSGKAVDHRLLQANAEFERQTGLQRGNEIGKTSAELSFKWPDDVRLKYYEIAEHGGSLHWERYNDSLQRYYDVRAFSPRKGQFALMFYDITERKRAEEALRESELMSRQLYNSIPDPVFIVTVDGERFLDVNRSASELLGYSKEELLQVGPAFIDAVKDKEKLPERFNQLRETGYIVHESVHICKNGRQIPVELHSRLIKLDGQSVILGVARNLSERKQLEAELIRYKDHLEEQVQQRTAELVLARNAADAANKAKSIFLANMSHELRTPLNAILGFSSMMQKNSRLDQAELDNLDIIKRSGEHLLAIINDVLDMANIETGRIQLEETQFDLDRMVCDVVDMLSASAKEKGLQLAVDQSSRFPRFIVADEGRLRQILTNLIGNAVKFTSQGSVTLRLGTKQNAVALLEIEVIDTGPGIPPDDQQRIFEPFVQLGEHAVNQGSGLGLTISRQFAQMMGGKLVLESAPGKGSVFRIELPIKIAREAGASFESAERSRRDVVALAPGQPAYRILIVEDQLENRQLLARLMESVGFQVKLAENGEQSIRHFQNWRPHLIWMDRRLPGMDGLEASRAIRELPGGNEVKIVAVTASAFKEQRDEMLNLGMDDIVSKPYRFNEIYECLIRHLGVEFIYADAAPDQKQEIMPLTAQMLSVLPAGLCCEFHEALESLDAARICAFIEQAGSYDENLGKTLARLADNFDYLPILQALQTIDR